MKPACGIETPTDTSARALEFLYVGQTQQIPVNVGFRSSTQPTWALFV